jgi:16S rRNA processing protein RimM
LSSNLANGGTPVLVGKIIGTHALRGELRVYGHAESASVFDPGKRMLAILPDGTRRGVTIRSTRIHKQLRLVCLEGVDHIDAAETLLGAELFIDRAELPPLESGTYYWHDLIGMAVETLDGEFLGNVDGIIPTGSNDVYVVVDRREGCRREILIPAIVSVVRDIDPAKNTMRVLMPEGLTDD